MKAPTAPMDDGPIPYTPGAHTLTRDDERVALRSIAGDDEVQPRALTLAELYRARDASEDSGPGVRSSSAPDRFGKDAIKGGVPRDANAWRDRFCRISVYEDRAAAVFTSTTEGAVLATRGIDGSTARRWYRLIVSGHPVRSNIHARSKPDEVERRAMRAAAKSARKRGQAMQPPPPRKPHEITKREALAPKDVADDWNGGVAAQYGYPRVDGRAVRRVANLWHDAMMQVLPDGWARPDRVVTAKRPEENEMASGDYCIGWKAIAAALDVSERTARRLADKLPLRHNLGGRGVCALRADLDAYAERERRLRATAWRG